MSQIELRFDRPAAPGPRGTGKATFLFLALFSLPFLGVGLFTAYGTLAGEMAFEGAHGRAMMALFSLVFTGVGAGVLALAVHGRKVAARRAEVQARHPGRPWMWRADWASGRLRANATLAVRVAWGVALFWNALSAPVLFAVPDELRGGNHLILIGLLFPAVGIGMLVWAVRATIRWRKFGDSFLEMSRLPAVPGGRLEGVVQTGLPRQDTEEVRLTLACVNRVTTGSGKNRSTHDTILWQEETTVPRGSLGVGPRGVEVPVSIGIAPDQPGWTDANPANRILWTLGVEASVPGVDYDARFEVPVFETGEARRQQSVRWTPAPQPTTAAPPELSRGVAIRSNEEGLREFHFGPARNPGAAAGTSAFLALWLGAIVLQVKLGAPVMFPIVFGVFAVLIGLAAADMWLSVARVIIHPAEIESRVTILGIGHTRFLATDEIACVRPKVGMQMRYGTRGIPYWDLAVRSKEGAEKILARSIRDKREAEWLAGEIERAAGIRP